LKAAPAVLAERSAKPVRTLLRIDLSAPDGLTLSRGMTMNEHQEKAYRGWAKFLNPDVLRGNLITASIFLATYEILRSSVIDRIRDFFTHGFDENGWIVSEEYQTEVLALDKSPLRASLLWLKGMSVLNDSEIEYVDLVREHRNTVAHDLLKFLGTADADINVKLLSGLYELVTKIDRWWIREVEMTIDPDHDGSEVADEDIVSGNMLSIQLMIQIATGEDSAACWEEFQRQVGTALAKGKGTSAEHVSWPPSQ
jgi:hypothetical protein